MSEKNISFDFDQAKVTTQQSLEMEDADASGQELEEEAGGHLGVRYPAR